VRARLVSTESGLARLIDDPTRRPPTCWSGCWPPGAEEVEARRDRLAKALTSFDEATITTPRLLPVVLAGLGVAGDVPQRRAARRPRDIVEQVVDDLYVRWTLLHGERAVRPGRSDRDRPAAVANPETPPVP